MDKQWALAQLEAPAWHDRLRAARFLAKCATEADIEQVRTALRVETVTYVSSALRQALDRATGSQWVHLEGPEEPEAPDAPDAFQVVYSQAIEQTTRELVHEIDPIVGALSLYAAREIPDFNTSKTRVHLDRLRELVVALDTLGRVASTPLITNFDIAALIRELGVGGLPDHDVEVRPGGPESLMVDGDRSLLSVALSNAIRNAVEATEEQAVEDDHPFAPVVVTWGETPDEYWIAVLDEGPGPPAGTSRVFEMGVSTKGHLGVGLVLVQRAMFSLGGSIALTQRGAEGGARLELRWPKPVNDRN